MKTINVKGLIGDVVYAINTHNSYPVSINRVSIVEIVISKDKTLYLVKDYYPNNEDECEWNDFTDVYETKEEAFKAFKEMLNKIKL